MCACTQSDSLSTSGSLSVLGPLPRGNKQERKREETKERQETKEPETTGVKQAATEVAEAGKAVSPPMYGRELAAGPIPCRPGWPAGTASWADWVGTLAPLPSRVRKLKQKLGSMQ